MSPVLSGRFFTTSTTWEEPTLIEELYLRFLRFQLLGINSTTLLVKGLLVARIKDLYLEEN